MPAVTDEQLALVNSIGESINTSVANNSRFRDQNPTLIALMTDPLQVLIDHGLPTDFFANTPADVMAQTVAYWKQQATSDLAAAHGGQQKRGFFRCWACRIGFGAVIAVVGLVVTAVTAGAGGAIFVAAVNFMVVAGMAMAAAEGVMIAATAVGGTVLAGGIAALIELICESIPNTCG
jgi:uncharacterized membrane protein